MKQIRRLIIVTFSLAIVGIIAVVGAQTKTGDLDRTVLPIPDPEIKPITELDARKEYNYYDDPFGETGFSYGCENY